jgi:hypothetical protein
VAPVKDIHPIRSTNLKVDGDREPRLENAPSGPGGEFTVTRLSWDAASMMILRESAVVVRAASARAVHEHGEALDRLAE